MLNLALALVLAVPQQGTTATSTTSANTPAPATAANLADAYANETTANFIRRARSARDRNERLVSDYTAKVNQRVGIGMRMLSRDRMLFHIEQIANISWHRDSPTTLTWLAARMGWIGEAQDDVPDNLRPSAARDLIIDPASDYLRTGTGGIIDDAIVLYPLSVGSENAYKFAMGDSIKFVMPTGKTINIVAVEVMARRAEPNLMIGTLWFDKETLNLVRAVYRPARPWNLHRDADSTESKDIPGWLNGELDVKAVTLDYGYYGNRWWMPRFMSIDGVATIGSWVAVPFRMERTYEDYEVTGGTPPDTVNKYIPAGRRRDNDEPPVKYPPRSDTTAAARALRDSLSKATRQRIGNLKVVVPADTASLLSSPLLGKPILDMGDMVSEQELKNLAEPLKQIPMRPWEAHVELPKSLTSILDAARYNRVEAFSFGTSAQFDFGRMQATLTGRLGVGDWEPNVELDVRHATHDGKISLGGYRRLTAANPDEKPFTALASGLALLAERDDGEYFRALGVEAKFANTNSQWWSARVAYEQQRPAFKETDWAIPHLFSKAQHFRPNFLADSVTELVGSLTLRSNTAISRAFTIGGSVSVDAARGDLDYEKVSVLAHAFITPKKGLSIAVSANAGTSTGSVSRQGAFFLGGPMSLRGYAGGAAQGDAFWLGRVDVGTTTPIARLVAFSDFGWAGSREHFGQGGTLSSVGIGGSLIDGVIRMDLARRLKGDKGWRLEFYIGGPI